MNIPRRTFLGAVAALLPIPWLGKLSKAAEPDWEDDPAIRRLYLGYFQDEFQYKFEFRLFYKSDRDVLAKFNGRDMDTTRPASQGGYWHSSLNDGRFVAEIVWRTFPIAPGDEWSANWRVDSVQVCYSEPPDSWTEFPTMKLAFDPCADTAI